MCSDENRCHQFLLLKWVSAERVGGFLYQGGYSIGWVLLLAFVLFVCVCACACIDIHTLVSCTQPVYASFYSFIDNCEVSIGVIFCSDWCSLILFFFFSVQIPRWWFWNGFSCCAQGVLVLAHIHCLRLDASPSVSAAAFPLGSCPTLSAASIVTKEACTFSPSVDRPSVYTSVLVSQGKTCPSNVLWSFHQCLTRLRRKSLCNDQSVTCWG